MPYETWMGVVITNPEIYAQYRTAIGPILASFGGRFRVDLEVTKVLQPATAPPLNRVFALEFPNREAKLKFFADPKYLETRARLFESSVSQWAVLSE